MADLEDFFSKRDKKKSKKKSSVIAGDLLEKKQEEEKKKERKVLAKKQEFSEPLSDIFRKTEEDEDWKDFEEKQEPNLADLRLKNLSLKAKSALNETEDCRQEVVDTPVDNLTLILSDIDHQESPWGRLCKVGEESSCAPPQDSTESIKHEEYGKEHLLDNTTVAAAAKYVPPSLRKQPTMDNKLGNSTASDIFQPRSLGKGGVRKCVPNISNIAEFPTLGNEPKSPIPPQQQDESVSSNLSTNPNRYIPPNLRGSASSSGRR